MKEAAWKQPLWKLLVAAVLLAAAGVSARGQDFQTSTTNVGYIDNALPGNYLRQRFDGVDDINRGDRAEYLYSRGAYPRINYLDLTTYLEIACTKSLSGFVEMPEQFVNPALEPNAAGLADMNVGFKWAFLPTEEQIQTFQFRVYIPTGNPDKTLGNGHASLEPGFLLNRRLSERWLLEGMFKDWIPLSENSFAGNILNYGVGVSYRAYDAGRLSISPVFEMVGWTVLSGQETLVTPTGIPPLGPPPLDNTNGFPVKSAAGDTIINAKMGIRLNWGEHNSFYAGYGRALTGDFWYKDSLRLEYRLAF